MVLLPEFVPPPDAAASGVGKRVAELVSEHEDLAAVMSFVSEHVAKHGGAGGPNGHDRIAEEFGDPAIGLRGERVGEHDKTGGGTFFVGGGGLRNCAAVGIERSGTFQMRRRILEPAETGVVEVGEDSGDGTAAAVFRGRRLGAPGAWIEMREEELVHGVVDGLSFEEDVTNFLQSCERGLRHGGMKLLQSGAGWKEGEQTERLNGPDTETALN
jgi:hypothetical protein